MNIQWTQLISSPPIVFLLFLAIGAGMMLLGKKVSAKSEDSEGKRMHYSCGEDLEMPGLDLNYHQFFRLALLFGILHIVALVLSTIPAASDIRVLPILYLVCAGIGIFILLGPEERRE